MAHNESSTLDELEVSNIQEAADLPLGGDITSCNCQSICLRESGRNACPCKTVGQFCSSVCHANTDDVRRSRCLNKRDVLQDSDSSTSSDSHSQEMDVSSSGSKIGSSSKRGRSRVRSRGRRGTGRGNRRGRNRGRAQRGRGGQGRNVRGRASRRGHGRLSPEENADVRRAEHEQQLKNMVYNFDLSALQRLALELLRRQPALFADVVNGEIPVETPNPPGPQEPHPQQQNPAAPGPNDPPPDNMPEWCNCGHCSIMPSQLENKCCTRAGRECISISPLFQQLVLDANVLDIAMRYREDILVAAHTRNNENFRHAAYRQYVLWQHGRLGAGNRRVVPSCCVNAIRRRYAPP